MAQPVDEHQQANLERRTLDHHCTNNLCLVVTNCINHAVGEAAIIAAGIFLTLKNEDRAVTCMVVAIICIVFAWLLAALLFFRLSRDLMIVFTFIFIITLPLPIVHLALSTHWTAPTHPALGIAYIGWGIMLAIAFQTYIVASLRRFFATIGTLGLM